MRNVVTLFITVFMLISIRGYAGGERSLIGVWANEENSALIEIFEKDQKFYGKIVWLREPLNPETLKPKTDLKNPDRSLQDRKIIGLIILKDLIFDNENAWTKGTVYDPNNGSTYNAEVTISSDGLTLSIKGYRGLSIFGRTEIWRRSNKKI
jgi:uncharacterized protein (DUF2147 family)